MTPKALSREIKFRVWNPKYKSWCGKDSGDWWLGVEYNTGKLVCVIDGKIENAPSYLVTQQFTGLHDKNGKEIYEGDIVKWHDNIENIDKGWSRTAIVNINPDLYFHCFDIGGEEHNHDFHYGNFIWKETDKYFEIIGNIYENQNLLTKENK